MPDIVKTSYDNMKVSSGGDVTSRSQLAADMNQPTKLALVETLRSTNANKINISDGIKQYSQSELLQQISNDVDSKLSNFKPAVLVGNVVQRRGLEQQIEDEKSNSSARKKALAGADPITQALAEQLKALTDLSSQKQKLLQQTDALKKQIDELSTRLINATNIGEDQLLADIESKLEQIQTAYDTTKAVLDKISEAYNKRYEAWQKLLLAKKNLNKKLDDNFDALDKKLSNLPEIQLGIKFPTFPKLPALNLTKANFKQQLSNLKTAMIAAGRAAAQQSIDQSAKESKPQINTGKDMDAFQTAASDARKFIKDLRKNIQAAQAAKEASLQVLTNALKASVSRLQKQAVVMEANINNKIDTQVLRLDANIKSIRSQVNNAQQTVANVQNTVKNTVSQVQNTIDSAKSKLG